MAKAVCGPVGSQLVLLKLERYVDKWRGCEAGLALWSQVLNILIPAKDL